MEKDKLEFAIFLICALSETWRKSPMNVYRELIYTGILEGYILENYEVLHTLGKEYLVDDITSLIKEKKNLTKKSASRDR